MPDQLNQTHTHTHTHTHIYIYIYIYIKHINMFIYVILSSAENKCSDDEVIFQDDNASCHRANGIKSFFAYTVNNMINKQTWI